ncbi:MAG: hypothetical protein HOH43_06020 [Candidatus Latescibacteria bacterium]|nr:hypothetical protein [Candidatus Latescibacterota bacterium]
MGQTLNIGERIELVPMDNHCDGISVALYSHNGAAGDGYLVHTYSRHRSAQERVGFLQKAMRVLGGLEEGEDHLLRFSCGHDHEQGIKRIFLEACKLSSVDELHAKPLHVLDKKSGLTVQADCNGAGVYRVTAHGEGNDADRRINLIAGGLLKLGQMVEVEGHLDTIAFPCSQNHDAMIGLLLVRSPNVRAALREQEMTASRGVLAAPSQQ